MWWENLTLSFVIIVIILTVTTVTVTEIVFDVSIIFITNRPTTERIINP